MGITAKNFPILLLLNPLDQLILFLNISKTVYWYFFGMEMLF